MSTAVIFAQAVQYKVAAGGTQSWWISCQISRYCIVDYIGSQYCSTSLIAVVAIGFFLYEEFEYSL